MQSIRKLIRSVKSSTIEKKVQQATDNHILWGQAHPDKRRVRPHMRVTWSVSEKRYVSKWMKKNRDKPLRTMYEYIQTCQRARCIFHAHHVDLDKLAYIFKEFKKTLFV